MSEIMETSYRREIADVTRDIRIKTGQFLMDAIEIGRLLFEAKAMVEPGKWGQYIADELPFSPSWANNYMRLYKELGGEQLSLFGNSQALANLRPTQALELLALPAQEREEFMQTHDVEKMSTRELHKEIRKELEQAQEKNADLERQLDDARSEAEDLREDLASAKSDAESREQEAKSYAGQLKKAEQEKQRAEKSEKSALSLVDKLRTQLKAAEEKEASALKQLDESLKNPQIPEAVMETMRQQVEATAAEKATADLRKQLDEAQKAAEAATKAKAAAESSLAAAEKQLRMVSPELLSYNALAQKLMQDYIALDDRRREIEEDNQDAGQRVKQFQIAMVTKWLEALNA